MPHKSVFYGSAVIAFVQRFSARESVDKHQEIAVSNTACYCKSILRRGLFRRNNTAFPCAVIKISLEMQHIELLRATQTY